MDIKMRRRPGKLSNGAGRIPGTPVHIGEVKQAKTRISVFKYDPEAYEEKIFQDIEEAGPFLKDGRGKVVWINIDGLHDIDLLTGVGGLFSLHPLVLEDVANTAKRPGIDDYRDYLYMAVKMLTQGADRIDYEQVSLVLGKGYVISFQEKEGDVFEGIRNRIRENKGRIRKKGADYLAYSLLDAVVDNYYYILEKFGENIEGIEERLSAGEYEESLGNIYSIKREALLLRKAVWPVREVINFLTKGESGLVAKETVVYFRDIYDHVIQVIDTTETFRDMISTLVDIYMSGVSNRMNEVMKTLTIFAAIFIPLTFIAGIYGMNFEYMPELGWKWGYFAVLGIMSAVTVSLVVFFKKKKWF
jgi:magnesium transporter